MPKEVGCQVPWTWGYEWLRATVWVPGTTSGSSQEKPILLTMEPSLRPHGVEFQKAGAAGEIAQQSRAHSALAEDSS